MEYNPYINIHADDYGMIPESNGRIRKCWEQGCINGISIMMNGTDLPQNCNIVGETALHLNLVEGRPLTSVEKIPLLVGANGCFCHSFFGLFIQSLSKNRRAFEKQVYLEIDAQLSAYLTLYPDMDAVSIDSHQHTHMIPLIFRVLMQVIRDRKVSVKYLRVPAEPIQPFLLEPTLYLTYQPVNILKNIVLNSMWLADRKLFRDAGIKTAIFCGIIFSGKMDEDRLCKVFPHFLKLAKKRNMDLEFLFHPGAILPGEDFLDPEKSGFCAFYLSSGRKVDADTVCSRKWCRLIEEASAASGADEKQLEVG